MYTYIYVCKYMARGTRCSHSAMTPRRALSFSERVTPLNFVSIMAQAPLTQIRELLRDY